MVGSQTEATNKAKTIEAILFKKKKSLWRYGKRSVFDDREVMELKYLSVSVFGRRGRGEKKT